jgi:diacylglycerol kinase (ATP)
LNTFKNRPLRERAGFALQGIARAFTSEASLKTQALLGVLALLALLLLRPAPLWWALFSLAGAAVFSAELLNTAIERLADELGGGHTDGIRMVKDCAAGAVLIAATGAVGVAAAFVIHLIKN